MDLSRTARMVEYFCAGIARAGGHHGAEQTRCAEPTIARYFAYRSISDFIDSTGLRAGRSRCPADFTLGHRRPAGQCRPLAAVADHRRSRYGVPAQYLGSDWGRQTQDGAPASRRLHVGRIGGRGQRDASRTAGNAGAYRHHHQRNQQQDQGTRQSKRHLARDVGRQRTGRHHSRSHGGRRYGAQHERSYARIQQPQSGAHR